MGETTLVTRWARARTRVTRTWCRLLTAIRATCRSGRWRASVRTSCWSGIWRACVRMSCWSGRWRASRVESLKYVQSDSYSILSLNFSPDFYTWSLSPRNRNSHVGHSRSLSTIYLYATNVVRTEFRFAIYYRTCASLIHNSSSVWCRKTETQSTTYLEQCAET